MTLKQLLLQNFMHNTNESFDENHKLEQQILLDRLNQLQLRQLAQQEELLKLQKEQLEFDYDDREDILSDILNQSNNVSLELNDTCLIPSNCESICYSNDNSLSEDDSLLEESKDDEIQPPSDISETDENHQIDENILDKSIPASHIVYDDKPIKSNFLKLQNYDELVEKELRKEHEDPIFDLKPKLEKTIKPFLKKGDGLAKYYNKTKDTLSNIKIKSSIHPQLSPINKSNFKNTIKYTYNNNKRSSQATRLPKCTPIIECKKPIILDLQNKKADNKADIEKLIIFEDEELDEFEVVEQYILDNTSFSSELSTISKIVANHKNKTEAVQQLNEQVNFLIKQDDLIHDKIVNFNDQETWDSNITTDETGLLTQNNSTLLDENTPSNDASACVSPPATKLMTQFFPKINTFKLPKESIVKLPIESATSKHLNNAVLNKRNDSEVQSQTLLDVKNIEIGSGIYLKKIKERMHELEIEIKKYKFENEQLQEIKKDYNLKVDNLKNEIIAFDKKSLDEQNKFEQYKTEQIKKFNKEKKLFENYQKNTKDQLNKKDREQIELLKKELETLREAHANKEQKLTSCNKRLRDRIDQLETENEHLKKDLLLIEENKILNQKSLESNKLNKSNSKINLSVPCIQVLKNEPSLLKYNIMDEKETILDASNKIQPFEEEDESIKEVIHNDGRKERIKQDGSIEIIYINGTKKHIEADGISTTISFFNGDIKKVYADHRIMYYYSEAKTRHTTYANGLEVFEFSNNQVEKHFTNGKKEIIFPEGTIKYIYPDGMEESILENGTIIRIHCNGDKTIEYPNGQKEFYNKDLKRREYPDGTVKSVFPDGRQETRYPSGRLRIKDKDGCLIVDTCI